MQQDNVIFVGVDAAIAAWPRRGDKGRDDRLFLEALHYFFVNNITWPGLPERYGYWNGVWKRFFRLNKSGFFEVFFEHLASLSTSVDRVQMFDSTVVRAHVSAAGAKAKSKPAFFPTAHPSSQSPQASS